MPNEFRVTAIGKIHRKSDQPTIEIFQEYKEGLSGLEAYSHIIVSYWFHENETTSNRSILKVHPRKDPQKPLTGVFATHAPVRPNLIAISLCKLTKIEDRILTIDDIDALDNSPLIDIKGYIPWENENSEFFTPAWLNEDKIRNS